MGVIQSLLLTALVFVGILTGITTFYGSMLSSYSVTMPSYENNITNLDETFDDIRSLTDSISDTIQDEPANAQTDVWYIITTGGYNALMLVFGSVSIFTNIIFSLGSLAGIPPIYTMIISIGITLVIVFAILRAIVKWDF